MLKKFISQLGFQGVTVDTILHNPQLFPGQQLQGEIRFQGSSSSKHINGIFLKLMTLVDVEANDQQFREELCIAQWHISGAFDLPAHQAHQIPFNIQLPFETPLTALQANYNTSQVWLHTHLDVDWGLDATDRDGLHIFPTETMQLFLTAMQQCGFHLFKADVEKGQLNGQGFRSSIGCYQELEFKPQGLFNRINEVEVSFVAQAHQTHVLLEIDRKFQGDGYRCLTLPHQGVNLSQLVQQIQRLLN